MAKLFLQGVILGLVISITIGPAFFAIIQTGIARGFRSGVLLALGIVISDLTLILLAYLGAYTLFDAKGDSVYNLYLGIGGGALLIAFGAVTFTRKPDAFKRRNPKYNTSLKEPSSLTFVLKGYFMNIVNPFLILFWFAAMSWVRQNAPQGQLLNYAVTFFSGTLIVVFLMDLLKSFIGNKIKRYLTIRLLFWINKIVGITLVVFGIALILKSVWNFL
ncbi:MAG: LysE family transporter [Bacteroidales bacterium]